MRKIGWTRRKQLSVATKKAYRAAKRDRKPIGWKEARERGLAWCISMWPEWGYAITVPMAGASPKAG